MNWLLQNLKLTATAALLVCTVAFTAGNASAAVFVYEVVTQETTFHTLSKLQPDAFLKYNGGEDVIYRLTLLKIYKDKEYQQAQRDYGLEEKNVRYLPHVRIDRTVQRRPYFWWR